jgi:amino acid adenylation domain-containing protein
MIGTRLDTRIAAWAEAGPARPAVRCAGRTLSRAELDALAAHVARRLRSDGVRRGHLVAVALRPSPGQVAALLGVLRAGAAYVPIDPAHPAELVGHLLDDADPAAVLCDAGSPVAVHAAAARRTVLELDDEDGRLRAGTPAEQDGEVSPDDPCYVIYTSGSTGRPKGCANHHRGVMNTLAAVTRAVGLEETSRMLQVSSASFDMSVFEVFGTLAAGACVVLPTKAERRDPQRLLEMLATEEITHWSSAPSPFVAVLNRVVETGGRLPGSLRVVLLGGDRFPPGLVRRLAERAPGARAVNVAGVTEVSYCSTAHLAGPDDEHRARVPWGTALDGQRLYVLDADMAPVPHGTVGELFIGGFGVGLGYWRRPELTAGRFLPDPFADRPGARMYRTGDLVQMDRHGVVDYLGRMDRQVKVAGVRIEPGEIESVLEQHAAVREAVVVAREDGGQAQVVAYVSLRPDTTWTATDCQSHLGERLPEAMVPHRVVLLEEMPRLPSGKLDRDALPPPPAPASPEPAGTGQDAVLDLVRRTFAGLLDLDDFPPDGEFFALGGDSLTAARAVGSLRDDLGIELPVRILFEAPTPRTLAAGIAATGRRQGVDVERTAHRVTAAGPVSR